MHRSNKHFFSRFTIAEPEVLRSQGQGGNSKVTQNIKGGELRTLKKMFFLFDLQTVSSSCRGVLLNTLQRLV
jgi:hypothetical protein